MEQRTKWLDDATYLASVMQKMTIRPSDTLMLVVLHGLIYNLLARGLINRVKSADPEYGKRYKKPVWPDMRTSFDALHIVLNMNLPRPFYPKSLTWRIWITRAMLALTPFIFVAMITFPGYAKG